MSQQSECQLLVSHLKILAMLVAFLVMPSETSLFAFCPGSQVESLAKRVAAVLPQPGAQPGEARPESHAAPKWNVHPTSTKVDFSHIEAVCVVLL